MQKPALLSFLPFGILFYILMGTASFSENSPGEFCSHDLALQNWLAQNPTHQSEFDLFEKDLRKYILEKQNGGGNHAPMMYTLPVVVHIVHDNGAENITDAQVIQGIQDMNDAFANVGYYDQGTGVDTEIQFCLAKRDPDGNATTGITRDQNVLTDMVMETEDLALKDLNRWEPTQYINIWLVRSITSQSSGPGVAGYAYFPTSHGQPEDGIVMEANYFGSTPGNSAVQTHEMGHYLGLYHTFQGGCTNNDCTTDGDRVCDTPPDKSTAWVPCTSTPNTCDTDAQSGFPTDQPDMFWNYMDYSDFDCYSAFTQGQTDRMHFTIENIRQSLLDSDGCLDPCTSNINASFTASLTTIVAGQTVGFFNATSNATTFDWRVDGTSFSNASDPSYTFNSVGTFEVILYATNADPNCWDTDTVTITVNCPTEASFTGFSLYPALGETLNFTNTSAGATSYDWLINGVSQSTTTDFSFTFDISGNYTVCLDAAGQYCDDTECVTLFVFDDSVSCQSTFIKTFGLPNSEEEGWAVCESDNGGFFMAGGTGNQSLLVKIDPTGTVAWARRFNLGPVDDQIRDIRLDSDGMLIGCGFSIGGNDPNFMFRYDHLADNFLWVKNLPGPNDSRQLTILEKAPGGNFVAFGQLDGCDEASAIELDRNTGGVQWMKGYALQNCQTFSKTIIADGSIFATGRYNNAGGGTNKMRGGITRLDMDGNHLWSRLYLVPTNPDNARIYPNGLIEDNGSLIGMSGGDNDGTSTTALNFHLYSTDLDGNIQWAKNMNIVGGDRENARHLVNLPDGYLMMGAFDSNTQGRQIFLVKTDKQGDIIWSRQYGDNDDEEAFGLLVNNGFIHFIGRAGTGPAGDFFLARLNLEGQTTDPCDQIQDLIVTSEDFTNPYDGSHPLTTTDFNFPLNNFNSSATEIDIEENPICESTCVEICDNGVDDDGDGYVDCYDDECPCNTPDCAITDLDQNFATELAWQSTEDRASVDGTPIIGNLDPEVDSVAEIVIIESSSSASQFLGQNILIFKGDGSNADNPAVLPVQSGFDLYSAVNPAIGDVDRNGVPELVMVSGDEKVRVYTNYDATANPPMEEWIVSIGFADHRNRKPYLADFNMDGISEVYVGDDIFQFDFSQNPPTLSKVLSGGSSVGMNFYALYQEPNCSPVAVDILQPQHCNGDPDCNGLELVAGNVIYSVDLQTNDGDGIEMKVQRDLNAMQNQHTFLDGYTSVADVDLDGILDVVVAGGWNNQNGIYVWDRNGVVAQFPHLPPLGNPNRSGALPCIANVFDDTQAGAPQDEPEIIVTSQGYIYAYSVNAQALGQPEGAWWFLSTTDLSGATGATVFDFNADGIEEIIYRDENNLRIMYGGNAPFPAGVDAERNWETLVCGSGTFEEHPVVADVDNDQQAEVVVTGYTFAGTNNPASDYRGRLRVFEADLTNGDPWMSARPIWNQYNYFVVNVNDDLTLPVEQQLHQLEFPNVGSGYRPFNKFVAQVPLFDDDYLAYLPVPDATVSAGAVQCAPDSIASTLTICNEGDAPLPAGTPIAFYLGDPTVAAVPLHHVIFTEEEILPDSCALIEAIIPTGNGDFYVVVNDDGTQPTPYNLGNDFPVTNIPECNYLNNIDVFAFSYSPPAPPDLGPDLSFCNNGVADLDAGPGWTTYEWQDGFPDQVYTAWDEGTYWVTVTDSCGYAFSDTIVIEMDTSIQFDLGPDIVFCPGDTFTLSVPGFDIYEWVPDFQIDCADCPTVNVTPLADTTYTLVATDANGCLSVDSISFTLSGAAEAFDTVLICQGDSILLFGNYESEAGDYLGTLPNAFGCDTLLTVTLELLPLVETADTIEICAGDSVLIFGNYESVPGDYTDTIPASIGCDTIMTITLETLPLVVATDIVEVCEGDSVLIFGNYESVPGDYTDTIPASIGCDTIMTITLETLPLIEASETIQICLGDSILLFGNYQNTSGDYAGTIPSSTGCDTLLTVTLEVVPFVEAVDTMQLCEGDSAFIFGTWVSQAGNYVDTLISPNSCDTLMTITLLVEPLPTASQTIEICAGDSVLVFGNYESQPGQYSGILPSAIGCDTLMTVTIEFWPEIEWEGTAFPSCEGQENGYVQLSILSGTPPFTYEWSNGDTVLNASGLAPDEYTLTITDANGCTEMVEMTIMEIQLSGVGWENEDVSCFGFSDGSVTVNDFIPGSVFSFDNENFTDDTLFVNMPAGEYTLYVETPNGCLIEEEVTVGQPPELVVSLPADVTIELGDSVQLSNQVPIFDSLLYSWSPTEWLSCTSCPDPWATPFETTIYSLQISDPAGCSDEDDIQITVLRPLNVYAPNAFSPNGDGVNDNFTLFAGTGVRQIKRLLIFDRWGELVFEGYDFPPNSPEFGWDGTFKGEMMNPAVFAWFAEIEFVDERLELMEGDVTLLR